MVGVLARHIGLSKVEPPLGSLPAAGNLGLQGQHGTHRYAPFHRRQLAQVFFQESKDLLPTINRLLLPIGRAVVVEEAMAGSVIPVELIDFAQSLQLRLVLVHLCWGRSLIFIAKEAEERAF